MANPGTVAAWRRWSRLTIASWVVTGLALALAAGTLAVGLFWLCYMVFGAMVSDTADSQDRYYAFVDRTGGLVLALAVISGVVGAVACGFWTAVGVRWARRRRAVRASG